MNLPNTKPTGRHRAPYDLDARLDDELNAAFLQAGIAVQTPRHRAPKHRAPYSPFAEMRAERRLARPKHLRTFR